MVLVQKYQSLVLAYNYILKIGMDDERIFEHTYSSHPVVFEITYQSSISAYIYILIIGIDDKINFNKLRLSCAKLCSA